LAVFLFGLLILLEYSSVLPHYTLNGFIDGAHYRSGLFVLGTFIVFATTIYLVVYMTTSISEQLRIQQQELEDANALLHQKDNLKNEYVLRLTHDIRGHLSAIQSCLDIVIDGLVGPLNDRQQDLVERSHRRSSKCLNFITALLRLTRMKLTGRLDKEMFPIAHIVYDALAAVDRRAASKQIELSHEFDEGVDEIYGEPVLLEETLTNILFNAVRYTPDGGKIALSVRSTEEGILIEVSDTGIGIPAGELEKIFEEFHRADNARRIERDGTGLGLSIARQVIERHGGRIWASNNDEVGSTFSIILPRDPAK
jgi:signal transduction histidine kinase